MPAHAVPGPYAAVLLRYGGLVEVDDREITLSDMYALNLDKLDRFEVLLGQPIADGWEASASESGSSEDEDGEADEDEDGDAASNDGSSDSGSDAGDNADASAGADAAVPPEAAAAGADVSAGRASVPPASSQGAAPAAGAAVAPTAVANVVAPAATQIESAWDDDDFEARPITTTTAESLGLSVQCQRETGTQRLLAHARR